MSETLKINFNLIFSMISLYYKVYDLENSYLCSSKSQK